MNIQNVRINICKIIGCIIMVFICFIGINHGTVVFAETAIRSEDGQNITLQGAGTINDPYLITSLEEFCYFRDSVNEGEKYSEQYIRLTVDLDLESIDNWIPIGEYGKNNYFYGVFDGAGHTISNLHIYGDDNAALFGALAGTVMNLGINSGTIQGACVGSIASHSVSGTNPTIISCYNRAKIIGSGRAGGIADNFNGGIIYSCWNSGELVSPVTGGICSYTAEKIGYSYALTDTVSSNYDGVILGEIESEEEPLSMLNRGLFKAEKFINSRYQSLVGYALDASKNITHTNISNFDSITLKGNGSKKDPYIIEDVDDLLELSELVNLGWDTSGCYFTQINTIDMSAVKNWTPIGEEDNYCFFNGIYDGNGYSITGLTCNEQDKAALFGVVNGIIMNLGIDNSQFSGEQVAAFAYYLPENGIIINCYNKAKIVGKQASGICLYNEGRIICCWSTGDIIGKERAGIVYAGDGSVEHCYSELEVANNKFTGFSWKNSKQCDYEFKASEFNRRLAEVSGQRDLENLSLVKLVDVDNDIEFSNSHIGIWDTLCAVLYSAKWYLLSIVLIALFIFVYVKCKKNNSLVNRFNDEYFYLFLLILTSLFYNLLFVNRTMNHIVGWNQFSARLIDEGKVPYRDYFYYLPPIYVTLARTIIKVTGGSFLLYRVYGIIERILIQVVLFHILKRYFNKKYVWIACFLGEIITTLSVFDGYGDYNETRRLFLVFNIFFAIKFYEAIKKKTTTWHWMILTGISLGLGVLCVQTGLAIVATFFIVLVWYCIGTRNKKSLSYIGEFCFGTLLPIGIAAIILLMNGALKDFYQQLFVNGNSKGSVDSLVTNFITSIMDMESLICTVSIIALLVLRYNKERLRCKMWYKWCELLVFMLLFHSLFSLLGSYLSNVVKSLSTSSVVFQIVVEGMIFIYFITLILKENRKLDSKSQVCVSDVLNIGQTVIITCIIMLSLYLGTIFSKEVIVGFYETTDFYNAKNVFNYVVFYLSIIYIVYEFIHLLMKHKTKMDMGILVFVTASAALQFIVFLGSGTKRFSFTAGTLWYPFLICIFERICFFGRKKIQVIFIGLLVMICSLSIAQRISTPYNWYGWRDSPITEDDYYTINISGMQGLRVNKHTKNVIEQVTKLIRENSSEDDFVFSFPHIKLYNILADRMEMPTFVSCYWFDVCPDTYVDIDADMLQNIKPEMIVWCDVGESAWSIHERLFRGGNLSSQRKIQNWYNEQISSGAYTQVGQVYNLSVYKLKDGSHVSYTYFENEHEQQVRDYQIQYGKMTTSFKNVFDLSSWQLFIIVLIIICLIVTSFIQRDDLWKKVLLLLLGGNLLLNIHPVYYLSYSLVVILLLYTKKLNKSTMMYFIWCIALSIACVWGYTTEWLGIKNLVISMSMTLFIVLSVDIVTPYFLKLRKLLLKNRIKSL